MLLYPTVVYFLNIISTSLLKSVHYIHILLEYIFQKQTYIVLKNK